MSAIGWVQIQKAIKDWVIAGSGLDADHVIWEKLKGPRPSTPYIELAVSTVTSPSHDWITKAANPLTFTDKSISEVDTVNDTITSVDHGLVTGDGPVRITEAAGPLPAPLQDDVDYWLIAVDEDTLQVAATFDATGGNDPNNVNPITPINLTTTGGGTIGWTPDTVRAGKELKRTASGVRVATLQLEVFAPEGSGLMAVAIAHDTIASLPLHVDELDAAGVGMSDVGVTEVEGGIRAIDGRLGGIDEPRAQVELAVFLSSELVGTIGRVDRVRTRAVATFGDGSSDEVAAEWSPSPPP